MKTKFFAVAAVLLAVSAHAEKLTDNGRLPKQTPHRDIPGLQVADDANRTIRKNEDGVKIRYTGAAATVVEGSRGRIIDDY